MSAASVQRVEEVRDAGAVPLWIHPEWRERMPWLVQGTTGAGEPGAEFDLGLSGSVPVGEVLARWTQLRHAAGVPRAVHSRQVHGVELCEHEGAGPPGLLVTEGYDGHLTRASGLLLTVSVADCVPVFVADPRRRAVAAVHAGWRGVAGGIVQRAIERMAARFATRPEDLWLHCGPAICGECYEVGPEVHRAVHPERAAPGAPEPIDLRAAIAQRAVGLGMAEERVSVSGHCTRCGPGGFFSHRGGSAARQMGVLAIRE